MDMDMVFSAPAGTLAGRRGLSEVSDEGSEAR